MQQNNPKIYSPMRFLALVSGGKDSVFTVCKLLDEGHQLVGILHIRSTADYADSYMFQTVGSEVAELIGLCLGCPSFVCGSECRAVNTEMDYRPTVGDEVEELFSAVQSISSGIEFDAISSGAILSSYQKRRVENVCFRLGKVPLAPLWGLDQKTLLQEMIDYGMDARIVKVASPIFDSHCLNMNLREIRSRIEQAKMAYELNYCGEGGEYETIVLDCRYFIKRVEPGSVEIVGHPEEHNKNGTVFYLKMKDLRLIQK